MEAHSMTPKFSISILAMNGVAMTRVCIESVLAHSNGAEIFLTDNASSDGTAEYFNTLARSYPFVSVITNEKNEGFAEPNNHALTLARGTYFITLNNDTLVPPRWLEMLENEFKTHPKAGLAGPSGTCCAFEEGATEFLGTPGHLEYVEGSCLMGRTELLREVGLFSPFIKHSYSEDVDLSLRLRSLGYTLHQAPFAIEHRRAASAKQVPNLRQYQSANHAYLLKRWGQYLRHRRLDLPFIVRRTGALGDCLLTTPLIRAIKQQNPRSEIFVECSDAAAPVFANNPHIAGVARGWQQHYRWATMINLDGAYEQRAMRSYVSAYSDEAGIVIKDKVPELFLSGAEYLQYDGISDYTVIHMGPSWPSRMWPIERWKALTKTLREDGHKIVLVGQGQEPMECDRDMRGKTTVRELISVMAGAEFAVTIDSFPFHVAVALGIPAVGLFGISYSHIVIPKGAQNAIGVDSDPAHPLSGARSKATGVTEIKCLPERSPMNTIEVSAVLEAVNRIYLPV